MERKRAIVRIRAVVWIAVWSVATSILAAPTNVPPPPGGADKNAPQPSEKSRYGKLHRILKFTPTTPEQIRANHKLAHDFANRFRKETKVKLTLVETAHFLVFTTWNSRDHRALGQRCEAMYRALCRQFDIPATRNIWAGKCPMYIFWKKSHFDAFTTKVDRIGATRAGGYNVQTPSGFTYLVLSHTQSRTWFYEVLIHESTHAFLGRYLTNRPIPRWANEGLAEYMASRLVKGTQAERKFRAATQLAVARRVDVSPIFRGMRLSWFDYGIAQSIVRFCAARDRKGFIRYVQLIKEGKSEADAMKEGMKMTHADLVRNWYTWARKQR